MRGIGTMNQINIISDLVTWIEKNLEQPLSIDHVAQKSGYSKWHLQRMFKKVTGQELGTYIRHRRLTHAALALKITSKPILEIAVQYRFDSQQTFTRSFKNQFAVTPASYRRNEFWDPAGLTPPIKLDKANLPQIEPYFITLPEEKFWGITYKNNCSLSDFLQQNVVLRKQFFEDYCLNYLEQDDVIPDKIYSFCEIQKSKEHLDEQEVLYTIALAGQQKAKGGTTYTQKGGAYLCFKYVGHPDNFLDFIAQVYLAAIPMLNIKLRQDIVVEIHYNRNKLRPLDSFDDVQTMECDYCVPIIAMDENANSAE